jgi:3-dehydroquinate dehydratase type I
MVLAAPHHTTPHHNTQRGFLVFLIAGRGEVPVSCRVILSSHNFTTTPPAEELQRLARDMHAAGADIVKIATMANDVVDSATVLSLLHNPPGRKPGHAASIATSRMYACIVTSVTATLSHPYIT